MLVSSLGVASTGTAKSVLACRAPTSTDAGLLTLLSFFPMVTSGYCVSGGLVTTCQQVSSGYSWYKRLEYWAVSIAGTGDCSVEQRGKMLTGRQIFMTVQTTAVHRAAGLL